METALDSLMAAAYTVGVSDIHASPALNKLRGEVHYALLAVHEALKPLAWLDVKPPNG